MEFESIEEYKKHKIQKHEEMVQKQMVPYEQKVKMSEQRVREFIHECKKRGYNCHVSVGGLDSIVLAKFIESLGFDVPRVSASSLEDKSIQAVHKEMGCINVKPLKSKVNILQDEGFSCPVKEDSQQDRYHRQPYGEKQDCTARDHHRRMWSTRALCNR